MKSSIGLVCAILLLVLPTIELPYFDNTADEYFNNSIQEATVAYATARVINASISIIKESELQVEPGGVGLSLAIGQILDPVDDITERLSDVLLTAIVSLGIQKLAFEIGTSIIPSLLGFVILVFIVLIWFDNESINRLRNYIKYIGFVLIIIRFLLPVSALLSDMLHANYFKEKIETVSKNLEFYSNEIETIKDFDTHESDGFWDTLKNNAIMLGEKTKEFKDVFLYVVNNAGDIVSNLVQITWLYVGLFVIQILFLPLFVLWLLIKLGNKIFDLNIT